MKPYIIAEIGHAHEGSLGILYSYIDALAHTGVDAVKFQMHIAEAESSEHEPFRVKFSLEDKTKEENSSYEVSKSKEDPNIENEIDLFSDQKKSSNDNDKSEFPQTKFNYKEFEKNIGGGDFSRKILSALQNQDLLESQITKAVIISCLEEIEEHKTKKGEVKVNAKKALKIFE